MWSSVKGSREKHQAEGPAESLNQLLKHSLSFLLWSIEGRHIGAINGEKNQWVTFSAKLTNHGQRLYHSSEKKHCLFGNWKKTLLVFFLEFVFSVLSFPFWSVRRYSSHAYIFWQALVGGETSGVCWDTPSESRDNSIMQSNRKNVSAKAAAATTGSSCFRLCAPPSDG